MHAQIQQGRVLHVGFEARIFGLHFDRFAVGKAGQVANLLGQGFVAAFELDDFFMNARGGQLAAGHFDGKFLIGLHPFLSDRENLVRTGLFATQQLERMANFG